MVHILKKIRASGENKVGDSWTVTVNQKMKISDSGGHDIYTRRNFTCCYSCQA